MDESTKRELFQRIQVEDSLRQELAGDLSARINRYLQVKPYWIIPNTHFAAVSAQCALLFRDGYFYACIALSQAVAEALVRFLCQRNSCKPAQDFQKNVEKLWTRKLIGDKEKESLLRIWKNRNDYHHLNDAIETDRQELEGLAREKVCSLNDVESEVFSVTIATDGSVILKNPKYWDVRSNQVQAFLRLEP
jgi:hypothetical protein